MLAGGRVVPTYKTHIRMGYECLENVRAMQSVRIHRQNSKKSSSVPHSFKVLSLLYFTATEIRISVSTGNV